MSKRGRPAKLDKAGKRLHSVYLDERAERLFRAISDRRDIAGWLNEYVSECIKRDFAQGMKGVILQEILDLQRQRDKLESEILAKAHELEQVKEKDKQAVIKAELDKVSQPLV